MFQQDYQKFSTNILQKTPEGYLSGKIRVTGIGVFRYLDDDRKLIGRLRDVNEVKNATDSINCKPVTLQHPNTPVNVNNVADLQVGMSANDASFDGLNNWVTITITDKKAVEAIEKGEVKAISMGYKCRVVDHAGVWQGVKHDQEQKDIAYNHIALVREGRAGDQVKFMVGDSAEIKDCFDVADVEVDDSKKQTEVILNDKQQAKEQSMKTIQLDGVDYQADEKVVEAYQAAMNDASEKTQEIHTLLDNIEELEGKISSLEDQNKKLESEVDEALINDAVNAKLLVLDIARMAGIECDVSDDISDIKKLVVTETFDGIDVEALDDEKALNALFVSAKSVIEKDGAGEGAGEGGEEENPGVAFDQMPTSSRSVRGMEEDLFDSMVEISHGKKKEG